MAELADAHGSGPCESNFMQVQVLLPAPTAVSYTGTAVLYHIFGLFLVIFKIFELILNKKRKLC